MLERDEKREIGGKIFKKLALFALQKISCYLGMLSSTVAHP